MQRGSKAPQFRNLPSIFNHVRDLTKKIKGLRGMSRSGYAGFVRAQKTAQTSNIGLLEQDPYVYVICCDLSLVHCAAFEAAMVLGSDR